MSGFKLNPAAFEQQLKRLCEPHAFAGGAYLVDALSQEGSGIHWPDNPNRSSAVGEYPAAQTEALVQSIDVRYQGNLKWDVGSYADQNAEGFQHAVELESRPPEQGGRPFLEKLWADPDFRDAVLTGKGP